jgi:hypothetical protein
MFDHDGDRRRGAGLGLFTEGVTISAPADLEKPEAEVAEVLVKERYLDLFKLWDEMVCEQKKTKDWGADIVTRLWYHSDFGSGEWRPVEFPAEMKSLPGAPAKATPPVPVKEPSDIGGEPA